MIEIGSFVCSKQGRDKDNVYVVKNISGKNLGLVDGNGKTLNKPKIKNIKHVENLNVVCEKLATKFKKNINIYDAEVYSAIRKFKNQ